MSDLDTYTHLPLTIDPQTKAVGAGAAGTSRALASELEALNALHRAMLMLETPSQIPPPPVPVNPKRSANIAKLRDSGNAEHRKGRHAEAVKLYDLGLQMALGRPPWEPQGLVREEVGALYANRAQARMAAGSWAEAAVDAEAAVEAKRVGNAKAWWRRGRCLLEMGRALEAREWVARALEVDADEGELAALAKEIDARIAADAAAAK